jgi:chromosome segregation protein
MKLRRVEILGFKSFGRKTLLEFPEGISAIVGPNGSGKSNVIDAICFGLGYPSRNLRAANAQELIHSGKAKPPHAKVSLSFHDGETGFEVDRKVDRSGKSVYRLDAKTVRRDGLHDKLGKHSIPKDGYNIVMQNDVMRFIEVKPKERREILDQISGISGYEEKKKKSLEELGVVERRISDTNLILSEKKGYLEEIGRDREMAMKYQGMQEELKKSRSVYYYSSLYQLDDEGGEIEKRMDALGKEKEIRITELARIDEEIDGIEQSLDRITKDIVESSGGESGQIKGEMGALKSGIEKRQEEIQFLRGEIDRLDAKKRENTEAQKRLRDEAKAKEDALKGLALEIDKLGKSLLAKEKEREERAKDFDDSELMALDSERKNLSEKLFEEKKALMLAESELESTTRKEGEVKSSLGLKKSTLEQLEKGMAEKEKELARLGAEAEKTDKLSKELEVTKNRLSELFQEFARTESEIRTIERMEQKMGESESLKFIAARKDKGLIGQVKDLGSAPDKYRIALDVAAGKKSGCFVVEDDKAAQFYIEGLRKEKIGRATFLPLNKISGPELKPIKEEDVLGYAKDLIKCDKKYQKAFDFIFGGTLVVRDIETARRVGIGKFKMVTLEGDLMEKGGAMSGGFYQKAAVSFSSTEEKKKKLESIKKEIASLKDGEARLEKQLEGKEKINIDVMRERKSNLREKTESIRAAILEAEKELSGLRERQKELGAKKDLLAKAVDEKGRALAKVEGKMDIGAFNEMQEALKGIDGEIRELREMRYELQNRQGAVRSEIESLLSEARSIDAQNKEADESISNFKNKVQVSIDQISDGGKALQELEKKHSLVTAESQKLFQEQERLNQFLKELGEKKGGLEAIVDRLRTEGNELEVRKAKVDAKLEDLKASMEGVEPPSKKDLEGANLLSLKRRINELERELGAIDGVNLRAADMYEELLRQYDDIKEKNERLYIEKEKIYDLIEAIEEKKKAVFFDSFYRVKENFEQIIPQLYPGTNGQLRLENESDPFNSGLILQIQPKGKEGISIDALSGGEKTLTAIAFLMATQSVTPSPFYILDEVDAALDQENVLRLVQFLKNRRHSQFILISHNPETVKHMDSVIGVHMQDGISKIIGVDMQTIEA